MSAPPQFQGGGGDGATPASSSNAPSSSALPPPEGATVDMARLMMLQQQHPPSSDTLRRLSIDTIGSSQRSFAGNPLRLPPPRTTADWQLLDAQWRLQQQQQQQQALLGAPSSLHLFGAPSEATNPNNALEMDLLYRTLLQQQQQQQQQQQSDTLLNLRQQQLIHDFALQQNPNAPLHSSGGNDGMDPTNQQHSQQQQHLPQGHFDLAQQYRAGGLRPDPLDWSRNSNNNSHLDAATLLGLQQPSQASLHFPHSNHANVNFNNSSRMALEEQLAMMNALQQQQQQQNSLFFGASSQQPHGSSFAYGGTGGNHLGGYVPGQDGLEGAGHHQEGAGSTSLLSALFAESAVPTEGGHAAGGALSHLAHSAGRQPFPAASKKSKAANAESAAQLPVRALSAYNFFFRDERDRIISSDDGEDELDPVDPERLLRRRQAVPLDAAKKKQLLAGHWYRDRTVKRRHRKTHGKIAFTALSKVISQAWRDLPEVDKAFYRDVAAEDLERYQREVEQLKFNDAAGRPPLPPSVVKDELEDPEEATGV